jgi:hypothetical protein
MAKKRRYKSPSVRGEWEDVFFAALAQIPVMRHACDAAGVSRKTIKRRLSEDPQFKERWREAIGDGVDRVEIRLHELAIKGSPQALGMYLKAHRKKYRDADKAAAPQQNAVNVHMYMPDNGRDQPPPEVEHLKTLPSQ